jgi:hypothetical protein
LGFKYKYYLYYYDNLFFSCDKFVAPLYPCILTGEVIEVNRCQPNTEMSPLPKVEMPPLCLSGQARHGQGLDDEYKGRATLCADTVGVVQGHNPRCYSQRLGSVRAANQEASRQGV